MKAWQLLDGPEKWTQGGLSRDAEGVILYGEDGEAIEGGQPVRWCVLGAMENVLGRGTPAFCAACEQLENILDLPDTDGELVPLATWNDDPARTFDEVRAALIAADV